MSKSVPSQQIWLGGADSKGKTSDIALALNPHGSFGRIASKNYVKLIYVHGECPQHKQVETAAGNSEIFVQEPFFCSGGRFD